jgi:hypothetical protein
VAPPHTTLNQPRWWPDSNPSPQHCCIITFGSLPRRISQLFDSYRHVRFKSLTTSLLEVMISSKNEHVFIVHLSDLTLQIIFDTWWVAINEGSMRPVAWHNSRHALSWRFYLHWAIEETGGPGIIFIIYHHVLWHPSEHGTHSMGEHLLAKAHITKLNKLTQSEVTELTSLTVNETAFAILRRQGSRGITIVSLQKRIKFNIQFDPYWPKWQTKRSKVAAKAFKTSKFHWDMWKCCLMSGIHAAHMPWNAIPNLELRELYNALRHDLVFPSVSTLINICRRAYALTVDMIKIHLPSWNQVCLALDGWTSMNKLAIMTVFAHYTDQDWALRKVQCAFNEVDHLFCSPFQS